MQMEPVKYKRRQWIPKKPLVINTIIVINIIIVINTIITINTIIVPCCGTTLLHFKTLTKNLKHFFDSHQSSDLEVELQA